MKKRTKLITRYPLYQPEKTEELFIDALKELVHYHRIHNQDYRRILKEAGFHESQLRTMKDLELLPPITTLYLKKHKMYSVPKNKLVAVSTSSGTRGSKSYVGYNAMGLWYSFLSACRIIKSHHLFSPIPTNYLILGYRFQLRNQMAVARTAFLATLLSPALNRTYALLPNDNGGYYEDIEGAIKKLHKYSKQPFPIRIIGFPSYMYFLLHKLKDRKIRYKLPKNSKIILGGGWKQHSHEEVEKEVLYQLAYEVLGISEQNIHESFGAVEHPLLYFDCRNHHFHIPSYARVLVRDVRTLEPVPYGKPGILNFIAPIVDSMPIMSIMTDDIGILHKGSECGCGCQAPYFEVLGRAGMEDIKTCTAGASQILNQ